MRRAAVLCLRRSSYERPADLHVRPRQPDRPRLAPPGALLHGGVRPAADPPERRHEGAWIEAATGLAGIRIDGVHLRLPNGAGPPISLEIFQYTPPGPAEGAGPPRIDRCGFGHLAFQVEDVGAMLARVEAAGGGRVGQPVRREIAGAGTITFVYARDPEGNILELQRWDR